MSGGGKAHVRKENNGYRYPGSFISYYKNNLSDISGYRNSYHIKAVAGRYISFIPDPAWSEEMTLTCMIYMAFIGASLAVRKKTHIRMTSFDQYMPPKVVQCIEIFDDLLVLAFSAMMLFVGFPYALKAGKATYVSLSAFKVLVVCTGSICRRRHVYFPVGNIGKRY